jgi:hypothetical protein
MAKARQKQAPAQVGDGYGDGPSLTIDCPTANQTLNFGGTGTQAAAHINGTVGAGVMMMAYCIDNGAMQSLTDRSWQADVPASISTPPNSDHTLTVMAWDGNLNCTTLNRNFHRGT